MHISKFDMKALKIDSDKIILDESIRLILQYKEKKGKIGGITLLSYYDHRRAKFVRPTPKRGYIRIFRKINTIY